MTIGELDAPTLGSRLAGMGLTTRVGPLAVRFRSPLADVAAYVRSHYRAFQVLDQEGCHLAVDVEPVEGLRRWFRPQVTFRADGMTPFYPLPREVAPALLEWGFNWSIGRRVHHVVVVHSAVVARGDRAMMLPAPPESGKSTLCAALVARGWRLGSDEFALVDPATSDIYPLPRPISLKERSVDIIRARMPEARFGPEAIDIEGKHLRHLAPPDSSVARADEPVRAAWVVVPKYIPESATVFKTATHARMLAHVSDSSYNYNALGPDGFECLARLVDGANCHTLSYSNLDEALELFDAL